MLRCSLSLWIATERENLCSNWRLEYTVVVSVAKLNNKGFSDLDYDLDTGTMSQLSLFS